MGNFLENVLRQLEMAGERTVLREVYPPNFKDVSGRELLRQVATARGYFRKMGLRAGDRCAVLGANSTRWVAIDLALMAEGIVVIPLYARQAATELALVMRDCSPSLLLVSEASLATGIAEVWPEAPKSVPFDEVLSAPVGEGNSTEPVARQDADLVTIIYTSGTSGEPKGVCLNVGNLNHMIGCTTGWMDRLPGAHPEPLRVFQYLPFNFAASWIVMISCLSKATTLTLSMDLNRLAEEIQISAPEYFFNVPTLLERVRRGVEENIGKRGNLIRKIFENARDASRMEPKKLTLGDRIWLMLGQKLIFGKIRERFGGKVRGLVCGSAPLAPDTQEFFAMVGIPIWQVYGLTETCGICTMDDPTIASEPGRVGQAIPGIEMKTGENDEIVVRGPHIFPGYWNRPEETARVLEGGWFHTGDQGEVNSRGNWRISGRIKNLIILNSGHNIAPEPIEESLAQQLAGAQHVVLIGNGRGYLTALITGAVSAREAQDAVDRVNSELPHYRQIRRFTILADSFTPESGLLTANGKIRRSGIATKYGEAIEAMYLRAEGAAAGDRKS